MNPDSTLWQQFSTQIWQLTLVIFAVGGPATICGRWRPHLAYVLWLVVLVKAVTPPLWASNLGFFAQAMAPPRLISGSWEPPVRSGVERPPSPGREPRDSARIAQVEYEPATDSLHGRTTRLSSAESAYDFNPNLWLGVWFFGMVALAGVSWLTVFLRKRTIRKTRIPTDPRLAEAAAITARQLGILRQVHVVVTSNGLGPALYGVWRPTVLLPECVVAGRTPDQWRPILVHELVHLRRCDHLAALLQCLVQIVWWFHPLVWWANKRICETRERCCDLESVQALEGPPAGYAQCLLEVLDAKQRLHPVYGFPGVRSVHVTSERIKEIMTMNASSISRTSLRNWSLALLLAMLVLPGAPLIQAVSATADESAPVKKASGNPYLLKYGDGKPDGKKSIAGAGEMIRFELPGETGSVRAIRVHGSRYGYPQAPKEDIEVTLLSEDMTEVLHTELVPYSLFKRSKARWTHLPFKERVEVSKKFWVVLSFNAEQTKGVYVSYDSSTKGEHSRIGFSEEDARETEFKGDWMVQVLLAKPKDGSR